MTCGDAVGDVCEKTAGVQARVKTIRAKVSLRIFISLRWWYYAAVRD
jgi:hypothetical protein